MLFTKIRINQIKYINNFIKKSICTECESNNIYGKICIKQVIHFNKKSKELELVEINPCIECKNFQKSSSKTVNNENLGLCKLFRIKENKKPIDTFTSRIYYDLCGPCGKYFEKKN